MIRQINKPKKLEPIQCAKCKTIFWVSKYTNVNSNYLIDCERHYRKDNKDAR